MQVKKISTTSYIKGKPRTTEMFVLSPEDGAALKNIVTGKISYNFVVVSPESEINNYIDFTE